ncbi:type IV pilus modification protein PilV [Variovorax sp. PCZ-1]|uniref:type IV pilus modification protein PilV n=1 Tax=Variovorax sp. PCZ-1 TaxID=2835533 RepID=UPI001BCFBFF1|nr:type IV pilus modification protein PilV [Variovorax sp. PCZ-1]MBS7807512.1 type IV pilus modification protein PilV [Variovorax sp. PCZ-1]
MKQLLTTHHLVSYRSGQSGASLIEVLVSILLLTVGLLGMAGLAAVSAANNKLAQIRSTSNLLVSDYVDRARANLIGFDSNQYELIDTYAYPSAAVTESGCTNASTDACLPVTMATLDKAQWRNTLRRRLPGGTAFVNTFPNAGGIRTMDIWIMWAEAESTDSFGLSNVYLCPAAAAAPSSVRCMYFRVSL